MKYIMLDAAVASEAYRPELQGDGDEIVAKYRPNDTNIEDLDEFTRVRLKQNGLLK